MCCDERARRQIAPSGYWAAKARRKSARDRRDEHLIKLIYEIRADDYNEVYGCARCGGVDEGLFGGR